MNNVEYAGFWIRVGATLIDSILVMLVIIPLLTMVYGVDYWVYGTGGGLVNILVSYVLPACVIIVFWIYRSATPGKMALRLIIVDADTGGKPTVRQLLIRYLGYYVAGIPFFLGLIWVGFDRRKQGWHDKLARTVVIRAMTKESVHFADSSDGFTENSDVR